MYKKIVGKKIIIAGLLLTVSSLSLSDQSDNYGVPEGIEPWIYMDFYTGMRPDLFADSLARIDQLWGLDAVTVYHFFRALYEKNNPSVVPPAPEVKIPKVIHQVWIGGDVPEVFRPLMKTWLEKHVGRGWKYKLWTDEDVKDYPLINREYYDATDNPGVKSDILKWEIIYNHGGVYVDIDHECLRALDILHHTYDFYTCLQPLDTDLFQLGAALFGATPHHPILKYCIDTVKDDWHEQGAPKKTGPLHFTKSFINSAIQAGGVVAALPAYYMYPLGARSKEIDFDAWIDKGAFAIHWWAKSWMPARYRRLQFRELNNDPETESWND